MGSGSASAGGEIRVGAEQRKMVFPETDKSFFLHAAQFLGKCGPFQIQVIGQLLAVKRDVKLPAPFLEGNGIEVGHHPAADGFLRDVKAAPGKVEILPDGDQEQIRHEMNGPGCV